MKATAGQLFNEWYVYHQENPHIYQWICRLARQAEQAGHSHYGIATIWEKIRWEITVGTNDKHFKMPNNHRAYYARHWNTEHPRTDPFFRTAELRSMRHVDVDRYGRSL
jgi:hypothetical protein